MYVTDIHETDLSVVLRADEKHTSYKRCVVEQVLNTRRGDPTDISPQYLSDVFVCAFGQNSRQYRRRAQCIHELRYFGWREHKLKQIMIVLVSVAKK